MDKTLNIRFDFEKENGLLLQSKDKADYLGKYACYLEHLLERSDSTASPKLPSLEKFVKDIYSKYGEDYDLSCVYEYLKKLLQGE